MRNVLFSLVVAVMLCLLSPAVLQATPDDSIALPQPQIEPEEPAQHPSQETPAATTFDIELSVQNAADLAGFEFDIVYNRATTQITGITPRSFFGQTGQCNSGTVRCAAGLGPVHKSDRSRIGGYSYGATAAANGAGLLAVIHIQTSANPDSLTFTIANALVVNSQGTPITQNVTLQLSRSSGAQIFLPMIDR